VQTCNHQQQPQDDAHADAQHGELHRDHETIQQMRHPFVEMELQLHGSAASAGVPSMAWMRCRNCAVRSSSGLLNGCFRGPCSTIRLFSMKMISSAARCAQPISCDTTSMVMS